MLRFFKRILTALAVVGVFLAVMQLVPYGRNHSNPPVVTEPEWDSPRTRELAVRACFDCHSNETRWPTYAHVAPFSWVVQHNVDTARTVLNFSDWTRNHDLASQASSNVLVGEMPPRSYRMMHPNAQLSDDERVQLARGFAATFHSPWRD